MINKNFQTGCVLIVGGSGGIGSLCAKEFAKAGAKVAITYYKNEQAALDIANEINKGVEIFQLDNKKADSVNGVMDELVNKFGSINTIVNAAGFDIPQKFISEIDIDLWKSVMDADVNGFFNLVKSSLPHLRASEGSMVFIVQLVSSSILQAMFYQLHQKPQLSICLRASLKRRVKME